MKKNDVKIGHCYTAKVSNRVVPVRIDSVCSHGGWNATNTATGKRIRVKSAQRLRRAVPMPGTRDPDPTAAAAPETRVRDPDPERRPSAITTAAQVLAEAGTPMTAKQLIATMAERGMWSSPNGKTPEATLHAAITREIARKGDSSRFRKVGAGQFEHNHQPQN